MAASSFSDVLHFVANFFVQVFSLLDHFYLVGTFSLLDFSIAVLVIDILISAFFVTFNVGVQPVEYTSTNGEYKRRMRLDTSVKGRTGG